MLSDCVKCWETPCMCGHDYMGWSLKRLEEFSGMIKGVVEIIKEEGIIEVIPHTGSFNDRVVRLTGIDVCGNHWTNYGIKECFYPKGAAHDSMPNSMCEGFSYAAGEDLESLRTQIARMHRAISLPVVDMDEFKAQFNN